uniref:Uncharacterized protein n=1 Tax=Rhizophagus irregularis (strain DAOM 181602 / DAOM 197198 / MUCL 43194) TaxID=747089 RepID=U9T0E1_RHIID
MPKQIYWIKINQSIFYAVPLWQMLHQKCIFSRLRRGSFVEPHAGTPVLHNNASYDRVCTTDEFLTYSATWYFPHPPHFEPITFRKKQHKIRKSTNPVSDLKDAIKAKKAPEISKLNGSDELSAINEIGDTKNEKYCTKKALRKLFDELEMRVATTPIDDQVKVVPEKLIEGKNGRRNLDYGIESRTTVGLVEVKKDDYKQGFAQATVQLVSSLGRKRKADKMDDEPRFNKVWGIVTDAEKRYFMEYEDIKEKAVKGLGHIIWLLEESQKADSAVNEKVIKKRKSLSKVAGNSDTVDKP